MPILMVALIALGVFGAIGALLLAAMILENRSQRKHLEAPELHPAALPVVKH